MDTIMELENGLGSGLEFGSMSLIIWGIIFSTIGIGYFRHGKKQNAIVPLLVGIALLVFPYFVKDVYVLVAIGTTLVVLPYFIRI